MLLLIMDVVHMQRQGIIRKEHHIDIGMAQVSLCQEVAINLYLYTN